MIVFASVVPEEGTAASVALVPDCFCVPTGCTSCRAGARSSGTGSQRGGDAQAGRGCKRDPDVPAAAHRLHGLLEQIVVHGVHQAEKPIFLLHRNTPSSSSLLRSRARVRNSELRMRPELASQASAISAMLSPYQ